MWHSPGQVLGRGPAAVRGFGPAALRPFVGGGLFPGGDDQLEPFVVTAHAPLRLTIWDGVETLLPRTGVVRRALPSSPKARP